MISIKKVLFVFSVLLLIQSMRSQKNGKVQPVLSEIISQFPNVRDFTISPAQNEIYFTAQGYSNELSTIIRVVKKDTIWGRPEVAPFSGQYKDMEAMFSPNGLRLYFVSNRPKNTEQIVPNDYDIWYIERNKSATGWSAPINIGSPINTDGDEFYPSIASNGNLYFTSTRSGTKGKDDIFMSSWENNRYTPPISLSEAINTDGYEYNSYIAPDESFLIFGGYNRKDGIGSGDLYISHKTKDKSWSKAKHMKDIINSNKMDYCPFYDIQNNNLYFTSKRVSIPKKNKKLKDVKQLLEIMNNYQNGLSRVYRIIITL